MWTVQLVWLLQTSNGCQTVTIETKNLAIATNPCELTRENINGSEKREKTQTESITKQHFGCYFIDCAFPQNTGPTVTLVMVFLLFSLVGGAEVCACHRVPVEKKEDNLQKLADSFHHVGPVDQTQATRAGAFTHWATLPAHSHLLVCSLRV